MEINLNVATKVVTLHLGMEHISLSVGPISRNIANQLKTISPVEGDLFSFMSDYMRECMSKEDVEKLFSLYMSIDEISRKHDGLVLVHLNNILSGIQEIIDYNRLIEWVVNNDKIIVPSIILDEYDSSKNDAGLMIREKTYIKSDYKRLCGYILMTRMVALAVYGFDTRNSDMFRSEIKAQVYFDMLVGTPLRTSAEYKQLETYVYHNREDNFNRTIGQKTMFLTSMSLRGVTEMDIDSYVMGVIILNHLSLYPILETVDGKNLMSKIYRTAVFTINNVGGNIVNPIKVKMANNSDNAPDDSQSMLENHRVNSKLSPGIVTELKVYYNDPIGVFKEASKYPLDMTTYELIRNDLSVNDNISNSQIAIVNGVLQNIIRGEILLYIDKESVLGFMAIAATILYQHGYYDMCKVVLSKEDTSNTHVLTSHGSRAVVNKDAGIMNIGNILENVILKDIISTPRVTTTSSDTNMILYGSVESAIWVPPNLIEEAMSALFAASKI